MALVRTVVGHVMRTNTVPDALSTCFKSLKIMWLFSAQAHEIKNIAIQDNIDQHLRRRHTEMDNIFQVKSWMDIMPTITKGRLDPTKALDVCKFATILGTPTQPLKVDPWLRGLLRDKPPTFENKLDAITTPGVTTNFLLDAKATIAHPEMKDYKKVASRVRAVKGFGEFMMIHEKSARRPRSHVSRAAPLVAPANHAPPSRPGLIACSRLVFDVWFAFVRRTRMQPQGE